MRALPWLLGGGAAAVALYYWTRRDRAESDASGTEAALPGRWVWPVGVWHGHRPVISSGFWSMRHTPEGDSTTHEGVDLMYRRQPGDTTWPTGTPHGTPNFIMPEGRVALAASDGVVQLAANTPRGWTVVLDHAPRKVTTYYTHLSSLQVAAKQQVTAGTPLGIIGADPLDAQHLLHLHFEVRRGGPSDRIDPEPLMTSWGYLPDPTEATSAGIARNAGANHHAALVPVRAHTRAWPRHGR